LTNKKYYKIVLITPVMDKPISPPPAKFRLVNTGPMGEPSVIKALLGPKTEVSEIVLEGFEVLKQPKPPEHVWSIIREYWDDAGKPYGGGYTLAPKEGKRAVVGCVEFNSPADLKEAATLLGSWSFHDGKRPVEAWFQYKELFRNGDISYITERLNADTNTLEPAKDSYREDPTYQEFVAEMARQAAAFREDREKKKLEGQLNTATNELKG
jgi:hypothetical protein